MSPLRACQHEIEQRLLERVRVLLASERDDVPGMRGELEADADAGGGLEGFDYDLEGEHLGVLARGAGCEAALHRLARALDRRLLCVACGEGVVWAWLGGREAPRVVDVERVLLAWVERRGPAHERPAGASADLSLAVGEPARGLEGWRLTHCQAREAFSVSLRSPRQSLTRYGDVALLAAALKNETLSRSLIDVYLSPLEDSRGGGPILRQTLHAYLEAERNVSSAAALLGVARNTVVSRLRVVEERIGRALHRFPAELEVALRLSELGPPQGLADSSVTRDSPI